MYYVYRFNLICLCCYIGFTSTFYIYFLSYSSSCTIHVLHVHILEKTSTIEYSI